MARTFRGRCITLAPKIDREIIEACAMTGASRSWVLSRAWEQSHLRKFYIQSRSKGKKCDSNGSKC